MKEWSKMAMASHADCHIFMVLVILVSRRWTVNIFPVWTFQYYDQGSKSHKVFAVISADSQCFLHPAMMIWPTISPRSFWASFFWPCLEPGKGGTWKQTTSRPETPSWCTLAPLLTGASSGLRTVERAIIWLHVWFYFIYIFFNSAIPTAMSPGCLISRHWSKDHICCLRHRLPANLKRRSNLNTKMSSDQWRKMEIHTVPKWIIFLCWNNIAQ